MKTITRKRPPVLLLSLCFLLAVTTCLHAESVSGTVVAWGYNNFGATDVPPGLSGVTAIAAGWGYTVAVTTNGTVTAWGWNNNGQLDVPSGLSNVTAVAARNAHTLALKSDGTVVAWGLNDFGQTNVPAGLSNVVAIAAGNAHSVALKSNGTVVSWGYNTDPTNSPAGLSNVTAIAAGGDQTVAVKSDGSVVAWGYNDFGETDVPIGLSNVVAIAAGETHTVALKSDGTVVMWGSDYYSQVGFPANLSNVTSIAAGWHHTAALKSDNTVVEWGNYFEGSLLPTPDGLSNVTAIAAGVWHSVAIVPVVLPSVAIQPTSQSVLLGSSSSFTVSVDGTPPFQYQWLFNGTNLLSATNAIYTITSVGTNHAGNYSLVVTNAVGIATSSNAALTVVVSPQSQTNYASSSATFSAPVFGPYLVNYQWQKSGTNLVDGGNLSGTTNSTLTIANVLDADAANYSAVVSNAAGSVTTSNATLTVNNSLFFATHPLSQAICQGSNVTFNATAYGAPPLVLQWYFNNSPIGSPTAGTTVTSYSLTNVQANQSGNYSVKVINGSGNLMSSNAVLTVVEYPPVITGQPVSQQPILGRSTSFTISLNGSSPFQYQWRLNGTNILNATNAIYAIASVTTNHNGSYSVAVTNTAGGVTSSNAVLKVIVPPTVALQILAGYPFLGLNGMLSSNFNVQYITNLTATNWLHLLSISNLSVNPYQFLDPAGNVPPARYYRAVMQ